MNLPKIMNEIIHTFLTSFPELNIFKHEQKLKNTQKIQITRVIQVSAVSRYIHCRNLNFMASLISDHSDSDGDGDANYNS